MTFIIFDWFKLMPKKVLEIVHEKNLIAILIPWGFEKNGIHFFTPNDFSQQLGYMNHKKGHKIPAHIHKQHLRNVTYTRETIYIKSGKVQVDFYTEDKKFIQTEILKAGDILFIASGGHGFTMLEKTEMIEVKQGPYFGDQDKEVFEPKI